jgi:hypothetical protein
MLRPDGNGTSETAWSLVRTKEKPRQGEFIPAFLPVRGVRPPVIFKSILPRLSQLGAPVRRQKERKANIPAFLTKRYDDES